MANTFTAPFAQTTKTGVDVATAATDATTSAPTNTLLIGTAGANGALFTALSALPRATVTDTALYLFISKDSGTTKVLVDAELMSSATVSASVEIPETKFANISESAPIRLEAGDEIYIGAGVALAGGITFKAEWTDF